MYICVCVQVCGPKLDVDHWGCFKCTYFVASVLNDA